jgi:hypothetical protein
MSGGHKLTLRVLAAALLAVAAILAGCGEWQAGDDEGWVHMVLRVDEEAGLRGLWPAELPDGAHFVAVSLPIPREEFVDQAMAGTNLYAFPERAGRYEGDWPPWDVYSFFARLNDLGPETMRMGSGAGDR